MKNKKAAGKLLFRLVILAIATSIIEIVFLNLNAWRLTLNRDLKKNLLYTLSDMETANWDEDGDGLYSQTDPILIIPSLNSYIDSIMIEADLSPAIPYIDVFYTNDAHPQYGDIVIREEELGEQVNVSIHDTVLNLRIDLGDDQGTTLRHFSVVINPVKIQFSGAIVVAVLIIYLTALFLFSLQKAPDYGLELHLNDPEAQKKGLTAKNPYCLTHNRVTLCPMSAEDIEKMRILRNKCRQFFVCSEKITEEGQQQWYKTYLTRKNDYLFSVFYQEKWVGAASIYNVDRQRGCAEFGRLMIDRDAAGTGGLGLDTTQAACRIAFESLGVHTVTLEVYEDNEAAKATYLKAGFTAVKTFCDKSGRNMIQMLLTQCDASDSADMEIAKKSMPTAGEGTPIQLKFSQLLQELGRVPKVLLWLIPVFCAIGLVCAAVVSAASEDSELFDASAVVQSDTLSCGHVDNVNIRQLGNNNVQIDADGWGFDPFTNQLVTGAVAVVNNKIIPSSVIWYERSAVGEALNNPVLTTCGWKLTASSTEIRAPADISFYIILADGRYMELSRSPYHYAG